MRPLPGGELNKRREGGGESRSFSSYLFHAEGKKKKRRAAELIEILLGFDRGKERRKGADLKKRGVREVSSTLPEELRKTQEKGKEKKEDIARSFVSRMSVRWWEGEFRKKRGRATASVQKEGRKKDVIWRPLFLT